MKLRLLLQCCCMLLLLDKALVIFFTSCGFCFSWLIKSRNCWIRVKWLWNVATLPFSVLVFQLARWKDNSQRTVKSYQKCFKRNCQVTMARHAALKKYLKRVSLFLEWKFTLLLLLSVIIIIKRVLVCSYQPWSLSLAIDNCTHYNNIAAQFGIHIVFLDTYLVLCNTIQLKTQTLN